MDAERKDEDARHKLNKIAEELQNLTTQLNKFKPTSEVVVGESQKQVSEVVNARLNLQSQRIESVNESVQKAQKTTEDIWKCLRTYSLVLKTWARTSSN